MKLKPIVYTLLVMIAFLAVYYFYPGTTLPQGTVINRLVVHKGKRTMQAYSNGTLVKTYTVALGFTPEGHKQTEGDGRTPEGIYTIMRVMQKVPTTKTLA